MPIDPRRNDGSAAGRSAQNINDLDRRITALEHSTSGAVLGNGIQLQTGGNLSLPTTGATQAVPGCSFSTTNSTNTVMVVTAMAQQLNLETTNVRLYLYLDGVSQNNGSVVVSSVIGYSMNGGSWQISLPAGNHTVALQAARGSGGTYASNLANASISYIQARALLA